MQKYEQLIERQKELNCLYFTDKLAVEKNCLDDYFKKLIKIIENGFQFISLTKVKIEYQNMNFQSDNFEQSSIFIQEDIRVDDIVKGKIYVYYSPKDCSNNKYSFLNEELKLLFSVASRIGDYLHIYENNISNQKDVCADSSDFSLIRQRIIKNLSDVICLEKLGIKSIYLIGSTKNHTAKHKSDIDLILHCDDENIEKNRDKIITWFYAYEEALFQYNQDLVNEDKFKLFDLHLITDEDITKKNSFALMINSIDNNAKKIL